ncbi:acetate--CoA ligase family protein [Candidatus Micrarchaeota archaeon]|nr:acetate--CoA ligase family protein [Candidatus Micrarchaeota archaeon]
MLGPVESFELLKKYGIPFPKTAFCDDLGGVLESAASMKFPVVLKVSSREETHKTEKGLVQLGIHNLDELSLAFTRLQHKAEHFKVDSFILQEQKRGVEFIIGGQNDAVFGDSVLFGLGGIYAELFNDVSVRVCPLTRKDAESMIEATKARVFFEDGFRGKKASKKQVVHLLMKTSLLLAKEPVVSLDFNPVIADENGASVVDARVVLR